MEKQGKEERQVERYRILLVDDNPHDIELTLLALEDETPTEEVKVVHSGREAVEYLQSRTPEQQPELVLLDLNMPHMNGIEVLDAVRSESLTRNIPVVVLTTSDAESDRQASYEHGANDFVVKNIDLSLFIEAIQRVIQRLTAFAPRPNFA